MNCPLPAVRLDLPRTGTLHVGEPGAHLAALTELPADAHPVFVVFFDREVPLKVAVVTHDDALQSGHRALAMRLLAERLFGGDAGHRSCLISLFFGIADAPSDIGVAWGGGGGELGVLESWTDVHVFVED